MNPIKEIRQRTGLSQLKFGEALGGIPLRTIQDWECEKRKPSDWVVNLIAYRVEHDPLFNQSIKLYYSKLVEQAEALTAAGEKPTRFKMLEIITDDMGFILNKDATDMVDQLYADGYVNE